MPKSCLLNTRMIFPASFRGLGIQNSTCSVILRYVFTRRNLWLPPELIAWNASWTSIKVWLQFRLQFFFHKHFAKWYGKLFLRYFAILRWNSPGGPVVVLLIRLSPNTLAFVWNTTKRCPLQMYWCYRFCGYCHWSKSLLHDLIAVTKLPPPSAQSFAFWAPISQGIVKPGSAATSVSSSLSCFDFFRSAFLLRLVGSFFTLYGLYGSTFTYQY